MKKAIFNKALALGLAGLAVFGATSCDKGENTDKTNIKNETDALIMATQTPEQVFNPFFSSSTADASIISMTQMGMLANDKYGNPSTAKGGSSVVVYDYEIKRDDINDTSTYYFVLRNDVKFSNGSSLTIKDVLFNLYVYLDPVYNGSTTIYSTDIVGLSEYRTQTANENEQDSFMENFNNNAESRIEALIEAFDDITDEHDEDFTEESFGNYLKKYALDEGGSYSNVYNDYVKAVSLFKEEIDSDWTNASTENPSEITFVDKEKNEHKNLLETAQEVFLYNEGIIKWNAKDAIIETTSGHSLEEIRALSEAQCKQLIIDAYVPEQIDQVVTYWATATELRTYIANQLAEEYLTGNTMKYKNISGIKFANQKETVTVNGIQYAAPKYEGNDVIESNEVLSITINGVDPKAIWNFAFAVAPMYYYSNSEQIAAFDYEEHFGVKYADQDFRDNVLRDKNKTKVPVGAGAYKASSKTGTTSDSVSASEFFDQTTVYFTRNDYFIDQKSKKTATIKNIYFRVLTEEGLLNALYTGEIDYCEPSAKQDTISELLGKKAQGFDTISVKTQGYGYVGINASKVENMYVRQAIMHSIDVQAICNYYGATAERINRSMSSESWAYPEGCTPYYPYIGDEIPADLSVVNPAYKEFVESKGLKSGQTMTSEQQQEFIDYLVCTKGKIAKDGLYDGLKYTFTIAGSSDEHPAFLAFTTAAAFLNKCGFQITVTKDSNALIKLTTGSLEVWAAAWSSTLDPDMYQVYHKDSKATAVTNWGYPSILNNPTKYSAEYTIVNQLSSIIMKARKTNDQDLRKSYYSQALDLVMQLAVELPTYQRQDLSAFNANKLDKNSLVHGEDLTSVNGVTSAIWRASLVA